MMHYPVKVLIRRVSDGVVRETEDPWCPDRKSAIWQWSEGNYGCDCNRGLFFARAANEPENEPRCGEGLYRVTVRNERGEVIYDESEEP